MCLKAIGELEVTGQVGATTELQVTGVFEDNWFNFVDLVYCNKCCNMLIKIIIMCFEKLITEFMQIIL